MSGYTIRKVWVRAGLFAYAVVNPSGVEIAHDCSWRVARKIADALNTTLVLVAVYCTQHAGILDDGYSVCDAARYYSGHACTPQPVGYQHTGEWT